MDISLKNAGRNVERALEDNGNDEVARAWHRFMRQLDQSLTKIEREAKR